MQQTTQRYLNRNSSILTFVDNNATALAAVARVATLKTELIAQQNLIQTWAQTQESSAGTVKQNVVLKTQLLDAIVQDLEDMARVAKVIDFTHPGFSSKYQMPSSMGEQSILGAARLFIASAISQSMQNEFISYGMPAGFLDDLQDDLTQYETLISGQSGAAQERMTALQQLNDAIAASSRIVEILDAIMHFVFANDKAKLSEWKHAKRLETTRAHRIKPQQSNKPDGSELSGG